MKHIEQAEITRDRWGRPIIDGVAYTRASTDVLSDKSNLIGWARRDTIDRLQEDPALLDMPSDELFTLLDNSRQASTGTAIHANLHEIALTGAPLDVACAQDIADAYAALDALHEAGYELLAGELFVVCQPLLTAGSFDILGLGPDGVARIIDLKTGTKPGKERYGSLGWAQQLATYAYGKPIDEVGNIVEWNDLGLPEPCRDMGVIVQVVQGSAQATVGYVDLAHGYRYAALAYQVRQARKHRGLYAGAAVFA